MIGTSLFKYLSIEMWANLVRNLLMVKPLTLRDSTLSIPEYLLPSLPLSLTPGLYTPNVWISFRKRLIEINPKDAAEKVK